MKKTTFYFLSMALFSVAGLVSCSQTEEPAPTPYENPFEGKDMVEWIADIRLPEEFKTRAAASGIVGSDGLYTFSREIDRLWYAVYYNGAYLYDSEMEQAPDALKTADGFTVPFKFHQQLDPTQIYIFFWAGNKQDNVTVSNATVSDAINLNFTNRCVSVNPKYMNGNNSDLQEYDSFSNYVQLSSTSDVTDFNMKVILKRPFAQIHVLSDEFTYPGVKASFPNGVTVVPGFGVEKATTSNYSENLVSPTTWFFDSSISLTPSFKMNEFTYSLTDYEFTNRLSGTSPERVKFKNRTMDYLGCYYVFAPIVKTQLKYPLSSGNTNEIGYLNLAFRKSGENLSSSEFAAVKLPENGIKANNRYVVYNKNNSGGGPENPNPGPGGFISNSYTFEVIPSPDWDATEETIY